MTDLKYKTIGIFTIFYPFTNAGKVAWNEIAAKNDGNAKIFSVHLTSTLQQFLH